jgi:hypothetical protein
VASCPILSKQAEASDLRTLNKHQASIFVYEDLRSLREEGGLAFER